MALGLVALLELGDKTQLATISLAARYPWLPVLVGASAGLVSLTAIAVGVGAILAGLLAPWSVALQIGGGVLFVALGLWTYLRGEETPAVTARRGPFVSAFALTVVAELGDKTQIAVLLLAATMAAPWSVFAGASLALILVSGMSVLLGAVLARILEAKWIKVVSAGIFVVAGVLLILEALLSG